MEIILLARNDLARHARQGVIACLDAANQPACFLQLRLQRFAFLAALSQQAEVALVDGELRRDRGIQDNIPAIVVVNQQQVRHHVIGAAVADAIAGAGVQRADQLQRLVHLRFAQFQSMCQPCRAVACHGFKFGSDDAAGNVAHRAGCAGVQLDLQAFAQVARTDPGGVERLDQAQYRFGGVDRNIEMGNHGIQWIAQVTVLAQRIDDGIGDIGLHGCQAAEPDLPAQVILQRFACSREIFEGIRLVAEPVVGRAFIGWPVVQAIGIEGVIAVRGFGRGGGIFIS